MPHLFRTTDGREWKASAPLAVTLANGTKVEAIWGGSAQGEKLDWWLRKPGNELGQTTEVAAVAVRNEDTDEVAWGPAPEGARVFFVIEPPVEGKSGGTYRIAKLVTAAASPSEEAYFNDNRVALFGTFRADGSVAQIPSLPAPPPKPPRQGELF